MKLNGTQIVLFCDFFFLKYITKFFINNSLMAFSETPMKNKIACCSNATELHGVTLCICIEFSLFSRWCVSVIAQICFTTISRCHSRTENTVMKILTCKNSPKCSWSRTCADPQQIYVCTVYIYTVIKEQRPVSI